MTSPAFFVVLCACVPRPVLPVSPALRPASPVCLYPWQGCSKVLRHSAALSLLSFYSNDDTCVLCCFAACSLSCSILLLFNILCHLFWIFPHPFVAACSCSCFCCWHYVLANLLVKWLSGAKSLTQFFWCPFLCFHFISSGSSCILGHESETRTFRWKLYPSVAS